MFVCFVNRIMLRVRYLPSDLTEVKFKDRVTFNYFYEQVSFLLLLLEICLMIFIID
jgi:hypothetical protein